MQAGLEWFAAPDAAAAEARVLKLTISALEATGLTKFRVTLRHPGSSQPSLKINICPSAGATV